jgi:hypothetical protein
MIGETRDILPISTAIYSKLTEVGLLRVDVLVLEIMDQVDRECRPLNRICNHQHHSLGIHLRDLHLWHRHSFKQLRLPHDKTWSLPSTVVADLQVATQNKRTITTSHALVVQVVLGDGRLEAVEAVAHVARLVEIASKSPEFGMIYLVPIDQTVLTVALVALRHHHRHHLLRQLTADQVMIDRVPVHASHQDVAHEVTYATSASPIEIAIESHSVTKREGRRET